jgi:hypothetical protein
MRNRGLTATGILAVTIALTTMVPAAGQAPARVPKPYAPARTPDGQPDLQGVWNIATITPLERPASLAEKQVLTDDEVASLDEGARCAAIKCRRQARLVSSMPSGGTSARRSRTSAHR